MVVKVGSWETYEEMEKRRSMAGEPRLSANRHSRLHGQIRNHSGH